MGKGLFIIDFFIVVAAAFTFGIEKGLYALLGVIMYSFTIDYIIAGIDTSHHVTIITRESERVREFIINELDRGVTIYTAPVSYTHLDVYKRQHQNLLGHQYTSPGHPISSTMLYSQPGKQGAFLINFSCGAMWASPPSPPYPVILTLALVFGLFQNLVTNCSLE